MENLRPKSAFLRDYDLKTEEGGDTPNAKEMQTIIKKIVNLKLQNVTKIHPESSKYIKKIRPLSRHRRQHNKTFDKNSSAEKVEINNRKVVQQTISKKLSRPRTAMAQNKRLNPKENYFSNFCKQT